MDGSSPIRSNSGLTWRSNSGVDSSACDSDDSVGGSKLVEAELQQYALSLGLEEGLDDDLMWLAREAFMAPVPPGWAEAADSEGRVYFCRHATGQTSWSHPTDDIFRELICFIKALSTELATEERRKTAVEEHLNRAHDRALRDIDGWSGPYDADGSKYYYNSAMDVSTWDNPLEEWQFDLATRHRILSRCVLSLPATQTRSLAGISEPEVVASWSPRWRPEALELSCSTDGVAVSMSPSSAHSFATAQSLRTPLGTPLRGPSTTGRAARLLGQGRHTCRRHSV